MFQLKRTQAEKNHVGEISLKKCRAGSTIGAANTRSNHADVAGGEGGSIS